MRQPVQIRPYRTEDEAGWVRCRVLSFLDCSYWNDIKREKERYAGPAICLVAEVAGEIVGLLDVEADSEELTCRDGPGAVLWHLAVLPAYRRLGVARQLWRRAKEELLEWGVTYCEVWTQEDEAANRFYQSEGFRLAADRCWLRCYVSGRACAGVLDAKALGEIYGPEELVFDAPLSRRAELAERCCRMDEVRLYTARLSR